MKVIVNLTQHPRTPEQAAQGVIDLEGETLAALKAALTFEALPTREEILARAERIADLAALDDQETFADAAMIGGAPYLMSALERALLDRGVEPLYAFSLRESREEVQPDGCVRKVAVFRHVGFVPA